MRDARIDRILALIDEALGDVGAPASPVPVPVPALPVLGDGRGPFGRSG